MTEDLRDTVNRLLEETAAHLDSVPEGADESLAESIDADGLVNLAEEASEVLAEAGPRELIEALGLAGDEDGPTSLPAAIATGDPDRVGDLRALLQLSKLAPADSDAPVDDEALAETVRALRGTLGEDRAAGEPEGESAGEESGEEESADEESSGEASTDESEDRAADGEAIRSALSDALADAREDLEGAFGGSDLVESVTTDDEGAEAAEGADDATAGADGAEEEAEAEQADEKETAEGGGLTGASGGDRTEGAAHLSTMPRRRPDMRAVARHSTVPKRNR